MMIPTGVLVGGRPPPTVLRVAIRSDGPFSTPLSWKFSDAMLALALAPPIAIATWSVAPMPVTEPFRVRPALGVAAHCPAPFPISWAWDP